LPRPVLPGRFLADGDQLRPAAAVLSGRNPEMNRPREFPRGVCSFRTRSRGGSQPGFVLGLGGGAVGRSGATAGGVGRSFGSAGAGFGSVGIGAAPGFGSGWPGGSTLAGAAAGSGARNFSISAKLSNDGALDPSVWHVRQRASKTVFTFSDAPSVT